MYSGDTVHLRIDDVPQFFFDNLLVESVQDLTRRMHQPRKVEGGPLLTADQPWETVSYFSCNIFNVIRDPHDGLFKCWYTDWKLDPSEFGRRKVSFHNWNVMRFRTLYAYSSDGVHWTKPPLGIVREGGHDTNIVLGGDDYGSVYCTSVFIDPFETNAEKRFKTIFDRKAPAGPLGDTSPVVSQEIHAAYSPDGIHWTVDERLPTCGPRGQLFDDVIIMSTDPASRQYVAFTRHIDRHQVAYNPRTPRSASFIRPSFPNDPSRANLRRVYVAESGDFLHWTEPYLILAPDDDEDNVDDGFYGMTPLHLGSHYVGLLNVLHGVDNTMEVQLAYSRDRRHWKRAGKRQPFLAPGSAGSWDQCMVTVPTIPIPVGDDLWIYHGGARNHHDWWFMGALEGLDVPEARDLSQVRYGLGLARLRLDGFVSLHALPVREGMLVTKPFLSDGDQLVINAACGPRGYVDVEVVDAADEVLSGCSRAECDTFRGDSVRHVVTWKGSGRAPVPEPEARGQHAQRRLGSPYSPAAHRKLRFYMRDAHLYSFRWRRSTPEENSGNQEPSRSRP